jgi:hypothetical protein
LRENIEHGHHVEQQQKPSIRFVKRSGGFMTGIPEIVSSF